MNDPGKIVKNSCWSNVEPIKCKIHYETPSFEYTIETGNFNLEFLTVSTSLNNNEAINWQVSITDV
jgi:hypothetical protein